VAGESFPRVDWVAVPEAARARRVNRAWSQAKAAVRTHLCVGVPRIPAGALSVAEFQRRFADRNRPVMLTAVGSTFAGPWSGEGGGGQEEEEQEAAAAAAAAEWARLRTAWSRGALLESQGEAKLLVRPSSGCVLLIAASAAAASSAAASSQSSFLSGLAGQRRWAGRGR
jgi:hypothetical protein